MQSASYFQPTPVCSHYNFYYNAITTFILAHLLYQWDLLFSFSSLYCSSAKNKAAAWYSYIFYFNLQDLESCIFSLNFCTFVQKLQLWWTRRISPEFLLDHSKLVCHFTSLEMCLIWKYKVLWSLVNVCSWCCQLIIKGKYPSRKSRGRFCVVMGVKVSNNDNIFSGKLTHQAE